MKRFKRIRLHVFRHRLNKNGFAGPKRFRGFREVGTSLPVHYKCILQSSEKTVKINVKDSMQISTLNLHDKQALLVNVCIITLANKAPVSVTLAHRH